MVFELPDADELRKDDIVPLIYDEFADYMWAGDLEWAALNETVVKDCYTGDECLWGVCGGKKAKVGVDIPKDKYQYFREEYARKKKWRDKHAFKKLFLQNCAGCWQCELCGYTQNYLITKQTLPVIKEAWVAENTRRKEESSLMRGGGGATTNEANMQVMENLLSMKKASQLKAQGSMFDDLKQEQAVGATGSVGSVGTAPLESNISAMSGANLMTQAMLKQRRTFERPMRMKRKTADYLAYVWRQNSNFFSKEDDNGFDDEEDEPDFDDPGQFDDLGCFPMCRVCLRHNCLGADQRVFTGLATDIVQARTQVNQERIHCRRGRDKTSLKADEQVSLLQNWIAHGAYMEGASTRVHGYPRWMEEVWMLRRSFTTRKKIWWCCNDKCRYPMNNLESYTGNPVCCICGMRKPRNNWEFWAIWRDMAQGIMPSQPLMWTNLPGAINVANEAEELNNEKTSIQTR